MSIGENGADLCIKLGDYVVIKRQKYTKMQKFARLDATSMLSREQIELAGILDQPYGTTFRMCVKEASGKTSQNRRNATRLHTLEPCSEIELRDMRAVLGISDCGADNRDVTDNGDSQALGPADIAELRDTCSESSKIIEKIVEHSKTFHGKTEYSQEKYLKKKEKKYFEFVQIQRPTVRLMADIFYRQDSEKILGVRPDTLSQIISYSGVSGFGSYLLYESGTNGLLPAAMMNSIGAGTEATLVHMHPGNVPQMQAVAALNLPAEQAARCISVNVYSVLREFYRGDSETGNAINNGDMRDASKKEEENEEKDSNGPICKKLKLDESVIAEQTLAAIDEKIVAGQVEPMTAVEQLVAAETSQIPQPTPAQQRWRLENQRARTLMGEKFNSLVIVAKEHPTAILDALLPFIAPSSPVVIFSLCKELLMELFVELKAKGRLTNIHLTSNWLRRYQILPNRTHPEVSMSGNSGFLLVAYTVAEPIGPNRT